MKAMYARLPGGCGQQADFRHSCTKWNRSAYFCRDSTCMAHRAMHSLLPSCGCPIGHLQVPNGYEDSHTRRHSKLDACISSQSLSRYLISVQSSLSFKLTGVHEQVHTIHAFQSVQFLWSAIFTSVQHLLSKPAL